MNVYDFDKTIYRGDSTVDFFLFALRRRPALVRFLPKQAWGFICYGLGILDKTHLKETFFSFLSAIDTVPLVQDFWQKNEHKIHRWYREGQQEDDVVISASPAFLLAPICHRLGVRHLIASEVDPHTGRFHGANCHGQEKVRRLTAEYGDCRIDCFYSDSLSDLPLARMATKAFRVVRGKVQNWDIQAKEKSRNP